MNLIGAPASFIEECEKATVIQMSWTHAVKNKHEGATTPSTHDDYEKDLFKWMQNNHPGAFSSYLEWDKAKRGAGATCLHACACHVAHAGSGAIPQPSFALES